MGRKAMTSDQLRRAAQIVEANEIASLNAAINFVNRYYPLPRCSHGNALQDHSGEVLAPSCGCIGDGAGPVKVEGQPTKPRRTTEKPGA